MLLYFSQLYGALVKSYVFFRLDRQKWTRQSTGTERKQLSSRQRVLAYSSVYMHGLTLGWLIIALLWFVGLI